MGKLPLEFRLGFMPIVDFMPIVWSAKDPSLCLGSEASQWMSFLLYGGTLDFGREKMESDVRAAETPGQSSLPTLQNLVPQG